VRVHVHVPCKRYCSGAWAKVRLAVEWSVRFLALYHGARKGGRRESRGRGSGVGPSLAHLTDIEARDGDVLFINCWKYRSRLMFTGVTYAVLRMQKRGLVGDSCIMGRAASHFQRRRLAGGHGSAGAAGLAFLCSATLPRLPLKGGKGGI
jgi:hypothetical protein